MGRRLALRWGSCRLAELPEGDAWLAPQERQRALGLRFPRRRDDYRLGRFTAKCTLARALGLSLTPSSLARICVDNDPLGAPRVWIDGAAAPFELSLSHRSGVGLCALGPRGERLGCDLERVEARSEAFVSDYFGAAEQQRLSQLQVPVRDAIATLLWSAKESALKALGIGLRRDTRELAVELLGHGRDGWQALSVAVADGRALAGWWRRSGELLVTVVSSFAGPPPVGLGPLPEAAVDPPFPREVPANGTG